MIDLLSKLKSTIYKYTGFNANNFNSFKNPVFILLCFMLTAALILAYSNHFTNGFHFDDSHTIQENNAIKEVTVLEFFKDASTFSTLASNQSYRPLTTLENALDYKLAGGLHPKVFHIHIFLTFLLTCSALFFFVKKLLDKMKYSRYNQFWGLLVAAIFGLLCANAETVNYIIQRAEIVSGLSILLGFVFFLVGGFWRRYHIYLLFPFIGFFSKEMAFVFAPLLLLYFLIFEEDTDLLRCYRGAELKKVIRSFIKAGPALLLTAAFYLFYSNMLPKTFDPGGLDNFKYLITQPMVMLHYIATFFVPYNLSADSDWVVFESLRDYRAILGILGVLALAYLALRTSKKKETKLFSFGLLWFFISLLPTSSFIAFAEVLNDHRSFIPYMGLTIAFVFGTKYLLETYLSDFINRTGGKIALAVLGICFLVVNAYAIRQRNKVWKDDVSLWHDVTIKSPDNGRGLMNYGLALMKRGDYANAEINFNKALEKLSNYPTIYVNLAILKAATGNKTEAEPHFKKALALNDRAHSSWYFYGRFLLGEGRHYEAQSCFEKVLERSPNFSNASELLMLAYHNTSDWEKLKDLSASILKVTPNNDRAKKYYAIAENQKSILMIMEEEISSAPTPEKYLDLSLKYFNKNQFTACIRIAEQAIALKEDYPEAYNNIGIAHFYLKNYDKAIDAYEQALKLRPGYELAQNNLANVRARGLDSNTEQVSAIFETSGDYINLSLKYYNEGKYHQCIEAAKKSIAIEPTANAYNNICSALNALRQFEKAIEACNQALQLQPDYKLAKGNLDYALRKKSNN